MGAVGRFGSSKLRVMLAALFLFGSGLPAVHAQQSPREVVDAFSEYYGIARSYVDNADDAYDAFKRQSIAVKAPFYLVAFIIFVIGFIDRVKSAQSSDSSKGLMQAVGKLFFLVGLASVSVFLVELFRDVGNDLGRYVNEGVSGGGGGGGKEQWEIMFGELAALTRDISAEGSSWNVFAAMWTLGKVLIIVFDAILIGLSDAVIVIGELLAACVLGGSIMLLPIFIALLLLPALSRLSVTFLSSVVAVTLWPVGWAFVTFILTVPLRALAKGDLSKALADALGSNGSGDMTEVVRLLMFAVFPLIVLVLNVGAPLLINRMVTTGGNAISAGIGKAAMAPVQAGAAAASLGASAAMAAVASSDKAIAASMAGGAGGGMASSAGMAAAGAMAGATASSRSSARDAAA